MNCFHSNFSLSEIHRDRHDWSNGLVLQNKSWLRVGSFSFSKRKVSTNSAFFRFVKRCLVSGFWYAACFRFFCSSSNVQGLKAAKSTSMSAFQHIPIPTKVRNIFQNGIGDFVLVPRKWRGSCFGSLWPGCLISLWVSLAPLLPKVFEHPLKPHGSVLGSMSGWTFWVLSSTFSVDIVKTRSMSTVPSAVVRFWNRGKKMSMHFCFFWTGSIFAQVFSPMTEGDGWPSDANACQKHEAGRLLQLRAEAIAKKTDAYLWIKTVWMDGGIK